MLRRKLLLFSLLLALTLLGAGAYAWAFAGLPSLDSLPTHLHDPSIRILDRNGRPLYEALAENGGRHTVVPLERIPLALQQASVATEDGSFYTNPGIDLGGILRAAWLNLRQGATISGGSTITQQVARNLLLDAGERNERSLHRKLREAALAWQLTRRFSKNEILALYLNQTYYGGLAYGVEAASQTYFGKSVERLDLAEAALIAGLPQAPALYNPFTDPEAAQARQRVVLGLMEADGFISAEQRALAERERLVFTPTPYPIQAPHFVMMVRNQVDRLFTPEQIYAYGGLEVITTLDLGWEQEAGRAITRQIAELRRTEDGRGHNLNNAALVALDPRTGEVLALVGSPDYFDAEHGGAINMALAPRQPGSALKPLLYAAALNPARPQPWTAATLLYDVRTSFQTHEGKAYTPQNYDLKEHGPVLVREALASSLNIPAVLALDHVGLKDLFEFAGRLGLTTLYDPEHYDLSLALGGGEVRLTELTAAYGAFANGGYRVEPVILKEIRTAQGEVVYTPPATSPARVMDARVAWLISSMLSDDDARLLGFGPHTLLNIDRPAAVKTGTTSNFHDNWTIGYTPELVVGVWAGNTSYEPMRDVNGLAGAAPIWHQFIRAALGNRPPREFARPEGLVQVQVCALSGLLPTPACPYSRPEWFIAGTEPHRQDAFYRRVTVDAATGRLAEAATPPERRVEQTVLDLPASLQPWAREHGLTLFADLQRGVFAAGSSVPRSLSPSTVESNGPITLVSPAPGSIFHLSAALDPAAQKVQVEAVVEAGLRGVTLFVDGQALAELNAAPFAAYWALAPGVHEAWAEAVQGDGTQVESLRVRFEVK